MHFAFCKNLVYFYQGGTFMNLYTQFEILSFDRIAFAHSLSANNYSYTLQTQGYGIYGDTPENGTVLEIGFVEQNPVILTYEGNEYRLDENCIFVIPPQCSFGVRTLDSGLHRHTSVEFLIKCRSQFTDSCPPPVGNTLTLPMILPPSQDSSEVISLIRSIVLEKNAHHGCNYFGECASFMLLLHKLSALVQAVDGNDNISPGNRRYCDLAKAFISENIGQKITVREVAEAVGLSKNYLTNIFSRSEGIPLMEYINRRKLSYMVELIRRYGYTLAEAGEHVGYSDVNYISRIFKKYYGMTVTEYRRSYQIQEESP